MFIVFRQHFFTTTQRCRNKNLCTIQSLCQITENFKERTIKFEINTSAIIQRGIAMGPIVNE